jgi:hypothetical protein
MKTDRVDESMAQLLETAAPELSAGWEGRAMARLTATRPARGISRRLVLAAVGVAALVGLGFVPIPMGSAAGALERALAQAEQATTVHMTGHAWNPDGDYDFEMWASDDGFYRTDKLAGGQPVSVTLISGARRLDYGVADDDGKQYASELFDPTTHHLGGPKMPDRSYVEGFFQSFKRMHEQLGVPAPDMKISERRERSLLGITRDVIDAEWTVQGDGSISGVNYRDGDMVRMRYEIDPHTGRLLRVKQYKFEGTWEPRYEAEYVWDVEIPVNVRDFQPPQGTKLTRMLWWEKRVDQVVAQADTDDWGVSLHSLDVNREGDIVLSLSRQWKDESTLSRYMDSAPVIWVQAADNAGGRYTQLNRFSCYNTGTVGYWTTTLQRSSAAGNPSTVTLTVYPYVRKGRSPGQSVSFRNIPLPPRQNTDDLFAAETEVIQY